MTRRLLLLSLCGSLISLPVLAAEPSGPRLVIEPESFDFGEALPQHVLTKVFRLSNQGTADLVIDKIATSCGCTVVGDYERVVAPGASTRLQVDLHTRDDRGRISRSVLVRSNDPGSQPREIRLSVTVVPPKQKEGDGQ